MSLPSRKRTLASDTVEDGKDRNKRRRLGLDQLANVCANGGTLDDVKKIIDPAWPWAGRPSLQALLDHIYGGRSNEVCRYLATNIFHARLLRDQAFMVKSMSGQTPGHQVRERCYNGDGDYPETIGALCAALLTLCRAASTVAIDDQGNLIGGKDAVGHNKRARLAEERKLELQQDPRGSVLSNGVVQNTLIALGRALYDAIDQLGPAPIVKWKRGYSTMFNWTDTYAPAVWSTSRQHLRLMCWIMAEHWPHTVSGHGITVVREVLSLRNQLIESPNRCTIKPLQALWAHGVETTFCCGLVGNKTSSSSSSSSSSAAPASQQQQHLSWTYIEQQQQQLSDGDMKRQTDQVFIPVRDCSLQLITKKGTCVGYKLPAPDWYTHESHVTMVYGSQASKRNQWGFLVSLLRAPHDMDVSDLQAILRLYLTADSKLLPVVQCPIPRLVHQEFVPTCQYMLSDPQFHDVVGQLAPDVIGQRLAAIASALTSLCSYGPEVSARSKCCDPGCWVSGTLMQGAWMQAEYTGIPISKEFLTFNIPPRLPYWEHVAVSMIWHNTAQAMWELLTDKDIIRFSALAMGILELSKDVERIHRWWHLAAKSLWHLVLDVHVHPTLETRYCVSRVLSRLIVEYTMPDMSWVKDEKSLK